jgi:plastocyanin
MRALFLLVAAVPQVVSQPSRAQGSTCSLSGKVTFSSKDPKVKVAELVVYVASKKRSVKLSEPRRHEIAHKDKQFVPRMVIVQKNDSVSFPNRDNTEHSVFTSDRTTVRINPTRKAEPEPVAFLKEGGFRIQCDIHSNMRAWVVVVPVIELATRVADDGTWRIDNVPAGDQVLKVLEPNGNSNEVRVTACANDTPIDVSLEGFEGPQLKRFNGSPYSEYQQ